MSPAALGVHRASAAHPLPGHLPLALVSKTHPSGPVAPAHEALTLLYCSCPTSPLLPVQHWTLGGYKQAATVMDKKITVSVRVDYQDSFFVN